ncbi:nodulation protein NodH [Aliiroseovarius sp. YM-037]|uniref:nodulation protein NodH n=1 Tax=Aliiroseovarius sp. YM-037 TaxID=3341728 RepID=UPI003A7FC37C
MKNRFDCFMILAEMRTGSNFLEESLNSFPGLTSYGEAFNPGFVGFPKINHIHGITLEEREDDPSVLLRAIRDKTDGLGGFRFFHDHDPRALVACLPDKKCAKVILTRNPVDRYVSWKIARETGQWKLTNVKHQKSARIRFDRAEFAAQLQAQSTFRRDVLRQLQISGQTAFHIDYDDLQDVGVLNGLARFLGVDHEIKSPAKSIKKQNPASLSDKVENHAEMEEALADLARFDSGETPVLEPDRGPMVPTYIAAAESPVIYLPIQGAPDSHIEEWFVALDGAPVQSGFTQKTLRQWMRKHPGHRSFSIVTHPATRAHAVFCRDILPVGDGPFTEVRGTLRKLFKLPLPEDGSDESYDAAQHRAAFLAFLGFLKSNLAGQTGLRIDPVWANQSQLLQGICKFAAPDMVLRAEDMEDGLAQLARATDIVAPAVAVPAGDAPFTLADIYDETVESAVHDAYRRDYLMFGYRAWGDARS